MPGCFLYEASLCLSCGRDADMFGDTSWLQKTSIFFIGHGLAALAFVVSGVKMSHGDAQRLLVMRLCSSGQLARTV